MFIYVSPELINFTKSWYPFIKTTVRHRLYLDDPLCTGKVVLTQLLPDTCRFPLLVENSDNTWHGQVYLLFCTYSTGVETFINMSKRSLHLSRRLVQWWVVSLWDKRMTTSNFGLCYHNHSYNPPPTIRGGHGILIIVVVKYNTS